MSRTAKRESGVVLLFLLLVVAIIAAAGAGWWTWYKRHQHQAVNVPTVAFTTTPACEAQDLSLAQGAGDGAAGTIYKRAVITNNSSHKCSLAGYPAAFLLDDSGTELGSGAASNPLEPPTGIILAAGAKAHVQLGFPAAANFAGGACSNASTTLQLFLPGSTMPLTTSWVDKYCPGFSVTALQPGA